MNPEINNLSGKNKKYVIILIVLILIALIASVVFFAKSRKLQQDPAKVSEAKILDIVKKVDKLISLPKDEVPVLATVSDIAPLANNPFFAKAKVGDEVLLYAIAQKAFLYDPKANIIVEVASLNIGN